AADLELSAVAVCLLGVRLPRRALARVHARGVRGVAGDLRRAPEALRGEMTLDDLDPPSFQFGRGRGEPDPEEPFESGPEPEELAEPEIIVRRASDEEQPKPRRRLRLIPQMSETTARVVVAIPWIVFAIAIVGIGGAVFAAAMIVLAIL